MISLKTLREKRGAKGKVEGKENGVRRARKEGMNNNSRASANMPTTQQEIQNVRELLNGHLTTANDVDALLQCDARRARGYGCYSAATEVIDRLT